MRIPTVTRLMVLTAATRSPARITGPASGNSTAQNRRQLEKPTAVADWRIAGSTEARASATERDRMAITYSVSAIVRFSELR